MSVLEIRSLAKRFGSTSAVRDVSFAVERGDVYGLLGPNGSGKTTTLACALGLLRPDRGEVRVLGVPAARICTTDGKVGAVFDGSNLVPGLTVRANLEYARRLLGHSGGRTIDEVLALLGVDDLARRRAGRLSLGQKKRVAVARALLGSPELVLLDEPLSALDAVGVRSMLELIRRLSREGTTLVLSSHRLHEMQQVVTRAGILASGSLVAEGTLEELLTPAPSARARYRISAAPAERAARLLDGLTGVLRVDGVATDGRGQALRVELDGVGIGALNRALVEAGCDVTAIAPEDGDLTTLFDALVADRGDGARRAP